MKICKQHILIGNILYVCLPCWTFLFGWCRSLVSIPASLFLLYLCYSFVNRLKKDEFVSIDIVAFFSVILLSAVLCVCIGMGGVFANFYDYEKHSMVIQDLFTYRWPVVYNENEPAMLTYYLGQYLIPSLIGKVFNNRIIAELSMGFLGWIGVVLLYLNLMFAANANTLKKQIILLILFFMFSGMLMPLQIVFQMIVPEEFHSFMDPHWFKLGNWELQYSSTLTAIKWVNPQYIIPCLGAMMLYWHKESFADMGFFILPAFLCGTWGFLCLVVLVVFSYSISCVKQKKINWDIVSVSNILSVFIGCVFFAYFWGNLSNDKPDFMRLHLMKSIKYYLFAVLPFLLFMIGFYVLLIWKEYKNDYLFVSVILVLTLIPCFKMGMFNDFVMRTSMPALLLLSLYIFKFLLSIEVRSASIKRRKIALSICLLLASATPIMELKSSFPLSVSFPKRSLSPYANRYADVDDGCMKYNYFAYDFENTFFYKYIARK